MYVVINEELFYQISVVIRRCFFRRYNGASFVRRCSDIWVTGRKYVGSATFVRRYSNISLWGRWLNLWGICTCISKYFTL